jgi:hypothetical protein
MNNPSKYRTGLIFGLIAGIIYMLILFVRYTYFGKNPQELGIVSVAGYFVLIILLFVAAYARKRQLGGYADVKNLFSTIFVVILVAELCFCVFNYVYLKYIDPGYLERFSVSTREWLSKNKLAGDKAEEILNGLKDQNIVTFGTIMMGFARAVIQDSIIGIIIAFILKNKKPGAA